MFSTFFGILVCIMLVEACRGFGFGALPRLVSPVDYSDSMKIYSLVSFTFVLLGKLIH